jgi:hypothetical protein
VLPSAWHPNWPRRGRPHRLSNVDGLRSLTHRPTSHPPRRKRGGGRERSNTRSLLSFHWWSDGISALLTRDQASQHLQPLEHPNERSRPRPAVGRTVPRLRHKVPIPDTVSTLPITRVPTETTRRRPQIGSASVAIAGTVKIHAMNPYSHGIDRVDGSGPRPVVPGTRRPVHPSSRALVPVIGPR